MGEISMSGSTRERGAAVIGLRTFHPAALLSTLLAQNPFLDFGLAILDLGIRPSNLRSPALFLPRGAEIGKQQTQ